MNFSFLLPSRLRSCACCRPQIGSGKLFAELARPAEGAGNRLRAVLNRWLRNATAGGGRLHERESSAKQQSLQSKRCEERHQGGDHQSYECKHRVHMCSPLLNLNWTKSGYSLPRALSSVFVDSARATCVWSFTTFVGETSPPKSCATSSVRSASNDTRSPTRTRAKRSSTLEFFSRVQP